MPSSFTQNLGLEKPATGEQAGTWGNTANTSYDSIDMATDGNATISLSASSYSLNTAQGVTSEGRNKVITWTGNQAAAAHIHILPNTARKLYLMNNQTTGGFSLIFDQGSGPVVTLQPGRQTILCSDGAGATGSVFEAFNNPQFTNVLVQGALTLNMSGQANAPWDLYYRSSTGSLAGLPVGAPGQILMVGAGPSITWGSAGGLQTPWVTNIDGAAHTLTNVASIAVASVTNVGRPFYVHVGPNENLTISASASFAAVTIETGSDAWTANVALEIRATPTVFSVGYVGIATANVPDPLTVMGLAYGQIRMVYGNYGVILRNDQSYFNVLFTNAGDPFGNFNGLRPFNVELSSGRVGISATAATYPLTVGGDLNITGTYRVNGVPLGTGQPQTPWATNIDGGTHSLSNVQLISCAGLTATQITATSLTVGGAAGLGITVTCAGPGGATNVVMHFNSGILTNVTFQ